MPIIEGDSDLLIRICRNLPERLMEQRVVLQYEPGSRMSQWVALAIGQDR